MIITRTPYRISFLGGGTDYPAHYQEHGGAVLSASINHYSHIMCRFLPPFFTHKYSIRYYKAEHTSDITEIQHPSVRECLKFMEIEKGVEMIHSGDIPAMAGIGSSSAFTVGFLHSLHALCGKMISKRALAKMAIHIEQNVLKENVGAQDQIASAFGGLNRIDFHQDSSFVVQPITVKRERLAKLNKSLLFFFTGLQRQAHDVAMEQIRRTKENRGHLQFMKEIVNEGLQVLNDKSDNLSRFGELLHESWMVKRELSPNISNSFLDEIYSRALSAGAEGGKLCGAGGGGFFLFYASPEKHARIIQSLSGLLHVPFNFEFLGSHIAYYSAENKGDKVVLDKEQTETVPLEMFNC